MKYKLPLLLIVIFSAFSAFAQQTAVNFYGVYSSSGDKNMIEMTRNLYFAQLKEMDTVIVTDKSASAFFTNENGTLSIVPKEPEDNKNAVNFFIEIESSGNGNWQSTFHIQPENGGNETVVKKEFSSYYKILTEAKDAIEETFEKFTQADDNTEQIVQTPIQESESKVVGSEATTESIAGTWEGENFIDKIVILRGGRGFVIYKNGATMNIQISVQNNSETESIITIKQAGKSNASFFPELQRKIALENAPTAEPLEWQLTLTDSNTLQGSKKTLIEDETAPTGAIQGTADVTWTRK